MALSYREPILAKQQTQYDAIMQALSVRCSCKVRAAMMA